MEKTTLKSPELCLDSRRSVVYKKIRALHVIILSILWSFSHAEGNWTKSPKLSLVRKSYQLDILLSDDHTSCFAVCSFFSMQKGHKV